MAIYSPFLYATVARSKMSTEYEYVVRDGLVVKRIETFPILGIGENVILIFSPT